MFSVREKPWFVFGTIVTEAPTSADAIRLADPDWTVVQEPIYTNFGKPVEGYRANVRSSDRKVLGVVSDRCKVVQTGSGMDSINSSGWSRNSEIEMSHEVAELELLSSANALNYFAEKYISEEMRKSFQKLIKQYESYNGARTEVY